MPFPYEAFFSYIFFVYFVLYSASLKFNKNIYFYAISLVFFIEFFLYNGLNSDWRFYKEYVASCGGVGCTYFEPAYDYLTYISSISFGFYFIPFLSILIFLAVLYRYRGLFENSNIYLFFIVSVSVAFLPLYFGALRQSISFSILLFSIVFLLREKIIIFLFLSLLSFLFHYSSIIVALFLYLVFYSVKFSFPFHYVAIALYVCINLFFYAFSEYLVVFDSFNLGEASTSEDFTGLKAYILPLERIFFVLSPIYLSLKYRNIYLRFFFMVSMVGAVLYLATYPYSLITAGRLGIFFRLSDVLVLFFLALTLFNLKRFNFVISALIVVSYILVKFYFTIYSVGFFA
jgi:hypothetical protein